MPLWDDPIREENDGENVRRETGTCLEKQVPAQ